MIVISHCGLYRWPGPSPPTRDLAGDWAVGHNILLSLVRHPLSLCCQRQQSVPLDMSRIHPECPDSDPSDRSAAADVLLRQEPDEEEDEEEDEGDGKEDDEDDDNGDGYSE